MQSRGLQKKLEELGMEAGTPVATEALARDVRESYERRALLRSIGFTPQ